MDGRLRLISATRAGDPHDDGGPNGEYALLYRDLRQAAPAIRAYFDLAHEATPAECK